MFDLTLLPIHLVDGIEQAELPGLYAANAPRRPARGRTGDQLLIMLTLLGNAPLSPDGLRQLLDRLTDEFFQTPGAVTSALRTTADSLNQFLLDRNLRNTSTGRQAIGLLNIAVLHGTSLYLCHGGPTHSYLITAESTQHWYDAQTGGRGLGLSRTTPLRYYQAEIQSGDRLLICPEAPSTWAPVGLAGTHSLSLDQLRRRLISLSRASQAAGVIHFQTGTGKIELFRASGSAAAGAEPAVSLPEIPLPAQPAAPPPAAEPAVLLSEEPGFTASVFEPPPTAAPAPSSDPAPTFEKLEEQAAPAPQDSIPRPASPAPGAPGEKFAGPIQAELSVGGPLRPAPTPRRTQRAERSPRPRPDATPIFKFLAGLLQGGRRVRQRTSEGLRSILGRLSPGSSNQPASLSPLTMVFIAIAVPLVIVTAALYFYNQKGRSDQYTGYYQLAVQSALQTQNQTDPNVLRSAWNQTLYWLDKADQQQSGREETAALRKQAQTSLDQLDGVERLSYQPAIIGGLSSGVNITQIIANSSDVYLLNSTAGLIIHALLTGKGYEIDPTFICSRGPAGATQIGNLIRMVPMPRGNEFNATVLAVDEGGNVLFCGPGVNPTSTTLGSPDPGWGKINAIAYEEGVLYVLDAQKNAVWVYNGIDAFRDKPHLYFGLQVPPLSDTINIEVNQDELHLLHADGHLTTCAVTNAGQYNTRCTDPTPYSDPRPGRQPGVAVMPEATFNQMEYTQPPDPSLYLLDSTIGSIYQFSLRLNYQRQFRSFSGPDNPFPSQAATAFAISPTRYAFVAFSNQVFYASLP
ncbi:MAG TPA: hypothetical protein VMT46_03415 [Anaerolineaceae bacterium]|nr:hypothetical protein [Anaerolineaceae bacterium]